MNEIYKKISKPFSIQFVLMSLCELKASDACKILEKFSRNEQDISDIYYAVKGAISRNFSWKDYAIQKGISLALCFFTLGCSAISQAAKAAQATSKSSIELLKQVAVACLETGVRELANYSTELAVENILSPLKSNIYEEIQRITNAQREKEYYDRIYCVER
jgi:hypothetical protein